MNNLNQPSEFPIEYASRSVAEIQEWLVGRLAEELRVDREKIKLDEPILSFGIDSVQVVSIMTQLEDWVGIRFSGNPLEDCSTINELATLVRQLEKERR